MIVFETAPLPGGWQLLRDGSPVAAYSKQGDAEHAAKQIAESVRQTGNNVRVVLKRRDFSVKSEILLH